LRGPVQPGVAVQFITDLRRARARARERPGPLAIRKILLTTTGIKLLDFDLASNLSVPTGTQGRADRGWTCSTALRATVQVMPDTTRSASTGTAVPSISEAFRRSTTQGCTCPHAVCTLQSHQLEWELVLG